MDLDTRTMSIADPANVQPDVRAGVNAIVDATGGVPQLTMKVDGRVDVRATLDTGNPRNVYVGEELVVRDKIPFLPDPSSMHWEPVRQIGALMADRDLPIGRGLSSGRRAAASRPVSEFAWGVSSPERHLVGAGGHAESVQCGTIERLSLGPLEYRPVPACRARSFRRREIVVGYDFLSNFNIVYDYPDAVLLLAPRHR